MNNINAIKTLFEKAKASQKIRRNIIVGIGGVVIICGAIYWLYSQRYISTDDAYVNANIVSIAPRVSGQISHLHAQNNQFVKAGDLLLELDCDSYKVAVTKARAQLAINTAECQNTIVSSKRSLQLVAVKALPKQAQDDVIAKLQTTKAAVELAKANVAQAELDLEHTKIFAPTDGWVTNMTLREGNSATANQPLFALVSNAEYWVDANLKETELGSVKPGQTAEVTLDMYPKHKFRGLVTSISSGSGAAFSLLPPQNAVGNWVKVSQRVPVKIKILNPDPAFPLRVGTTASVTIDKGSKTN